MGRVILLTGATGFIGSRVAQRLLDEPETELIALVRAADSAEAGSRLLRAWWDIPGLEDAIPGKVRAVSGDVRSRWLGMSEDTYAELARKVSVIIHTAADLRIDGSLEDLRETNVQGVRHVLELAREVHGHHGLERLVHVSTAYVAGGRSGVIDEGPPSARFGFLNAYERSKYEGEMLVRAAMEDLPIAIARPSMVVGDSSTGAAKTFNTFYTPLREYMTGRVRLLPMRPSLRVNIVPVDHVVEGIVRMALDPTAVGSTFHLTAPTESLPTARQVVDTVRAWARHDLGVRLPQPLFAPIPIPSAPRRERAGTHGRPRPWATLLPYFQERRTFLRGNTDRLLGPYDLAWRDFLPRLLAYASRYGFLHRTERTVHEQLLHRLGGPGRTITYHDVVGGRHRVRRPSDMRDDVRAVAASLRALGVARGERIGVVGPNCTRYLAIDLAIGIVGAVAVPLYPTSPPAEIAEIVAASGATLLFVGSRQVLERLRSLPDDVRVVSFCRDQRPSKAALEFDTWETFVARGATTSPGREIHTALVAPDDIATIRYTSGTTGAPKGVVFDHRAIRWMAETMASLVPWRTRNTPARYVSFLPMNHVVEGILATYGTAYLPAPVDVWFVEDLADLPRVLPLVRPVVFFGVPRVYEKLWDRFSRSDAGRRYLSWSAAVRLIARPLLRRGLLRAAGLDRCAQLIVGSAPASDALLRSFHELGVEIHDAYGLTEAPLVTLNRAGRNRIGTVGEPLPDTQVRIAKDGEVMVRGPQLTREYLGETDQPLRDGWLHTGDLGRLTDAGALVIDGRKKDVIKTSYGKYVRASRIEGMLREIPGVNEALVVGEGRPFCVALLWLDETHRDSASRTTVDASILSLNAGLSHPEQVKRWAILDEDLSVGSGDLTPNLKLRRPVVLRRFAQQVDALYEERTSAPIDGYHVGTAPREGAIP